MVGTLPGTDHIPNGQLLSSHYRPNKLPNPVAVRPSKDKTMPVSDIMIAQGMKPIMTVRMVFPQVKSRASCTATNQAITKATQEMTITGPSMYDKASEKVAMMPRTPTAVQMEARPIVRTNSLKVTSALKLLRPTQLMTAAAMAKPVIAVIRPMPVLTNRSKILWEANDPS